MPLTYNEMHRGVLDEIEPEWVIGCVITGQVVEDSPIYFISMTDISGKRFDPNRIAVVGFEDGAEGTDPSTYYKIGSVIEAVGFVSYEEFEYVGTDGVARSLPLFFILESKFERPTQNCGW